MSEEPSFLSTSPCPLIPVHHTEVADYREQWGHTETTAFYAILATFIPLLPLATSMRKLQVVKIFQVF